MTRATAAPRTCLYCAQQSNLGEELDEITGPHRACLYEVLVRVAHKPAAHKDVQDVVDVVFGLRQRHVPLCREGSRQIRVAAMMVLSSLQQDVGIGIASRTDDVVHTPTVFIPPVPAE